MFDNINLNLYKTFYEVAKYGNISLTAEKTYTSQSSISRAIKKLEEELGVQLFYRNLTGVELTEKGKILFNHIETVFESLKLADKELKNTKTFEKGSISIGIPSQIGSFLIFDKIEKFHKMYPNIEITIVSKTTTQLMKLLKSHELDFIIDTTPIPEKYHDFKIIELKELDNCFVCSKKISSTIINSIKELKDLESHPLILPIPNTQNRKDLDTTFKNFNINPSDIINIHTSEMIVAAVKRNLGIGYIIKDVIENELKYGELTLLNIKEKLPNTKICLVYDTKNLAKAPEYFINNYLDIQL